jgi:hypothetical protein
MPPHSTKHTLPLPAAASSDQPDAILSYIVRKKSSGDVTPYEGISCLAAKVEPGRIYTDRKEAEADAAKLSSVSLIEFDVVWIPAAEAAAEVEAEMAADEFCLKRNAP